MLIDGGDQNCINIAKINLNIKDINQNSSISRNNLHNTNKFATTSVTSNTSNKAYYVEEKTKVIENIIIKVQPIVNEFQRIIKEYTTVYKLNE
jgi:hypothetical protein